MYVFAYWISVAQRRNKEPHWTFNLTLITRLMVIRITRGKSIMFLEQKK